MTIWVDADACPRPVKELLFKTAVRKRIPLVLVANQPLSIPLSHWIKQWQVTSGLDKADEYIIANLIAGDLVITADIPFAHEAVTNGALALNPRGELYTKTNINHHLARRNTNEHLRNAFNLNTQNNKLTPKEVHLFANHLDKFLSLARFGDHP